MAHPVFRDGVPPEKGNARVYLPIRLGNADALRALDDGEVRLVYIDSLRSFFRKDTADTTTPDNGTSTIHDFNGIRWKRLQAGGLNINAAGPLSGRDAFDSEEPGFVYFATDEELIYVRLDAGGWSNGTPIRGPAGTNFEPDETGTFSGRSAFDDEDEGFAYLSIDGDGDEITTAVIFVKLSSSSADWSDAIPFQGPEGPQGESAFVYIAYASADDGTDFTTTFNPALDYIAVRATTTAIGSPQASDFAGLWKRYKGEPGNDGADGTDPGYLLNYSTEDTDPPASGEITFDNVNLSAATKMRVSKTDREGDSIETRLIELYDAVRTRKDNVVVRSTVAGEHASFAIAGMSDETGYVEFDIEGHDGSTSLTVGAVSLQPDRAGPDGAGAQNFLQLDDTPAAYTSQDGKIVAVNSTPDGLEFIDRHVIISTAIDAAAAKTTPHDNDLVGIVDSEASNVLKKITFANLWAWVLGKIFGTVSPGTMSEASNELDYDVLSGAKTYFEHTLSGNAELQAPSNAPVGSTIELLIDPDSNDLTFASAYEGPGDEQPTITEECLLVVKVASGPRYLVHVAGEGYGNGA